jgi:cell pole-organizing protein PopZ
MSDQEAQQEPSMEEILASIRRIISEDGDEETAAAPEEAAAEVDAPEALADPEPEPEPEVAEVAEEEEVLELTDEEEVLELTDEVQDDGTVVNLNTGEEVPEDDAPDEVVEEPQAEDEEEIELEMVDSDEPTEQPEENIAEPEADPEPEPEAEPEPEPEPVAVAEPEPVDALAAQAADRLVSENPAMNSVASLSALAAAVDTHRRAVDPSIGPRTIEDLVKDVMRPMIREWLDDNLPSLVERMVGREIERLTREAEDISQR